MHSTQSCRQQAAAWAAPKLLSLALITALVALTAEAHNLDTRATGISFAQDFIQTMSQRASLSQPLVQVGDEFWVLLKTTPGPGTPTGVGGYQTFYIPSGVHVIDAAYVRPVTTTTDARGFGPITMKGQSPIAIGAGPIGAKIETGLNPGGSGITLGPNILGVSEKTVTDAGLARGTIAGVYADTGIFFSTDPRTAFNSYGAALSGGTPPMINNSGDTVGEWDAANVLGTNVLGVMTLWDSYQLRAFGRKDVAAIIDPLDERGNGPWGMASAVAGPQSGYAWSFNYANYNGTAASIQNCIEVGPWQRIQYPGSQVSKDQAGLISTALGYAGVDASSLGIASTAIPANATAVRFAIGQLEYGRSEYSAVKVHIDSTPSATCYQMYADAFGGDAGGTSSGKDHIWRYFDPTVISLQPCVFLQKVAADPHIAPGETTSFKITFANNGTVALPNIVLSDPLPSGLTYVSAVPAPTTISGSTLTWTVGTVQPNQIVNLTIYVKGTGTGTLINEVTATSNGSVVAVADDTVDIGLYALLREVKTVTPSSTSPGSTVTYTITVYNDGPGPNGVPLLVTDLLPTNFTYSSFVSATVNGASITPTINSANPNQPSFTISQGIGADKTAVINFVATVGAGVAVGTYYNGVKMDFESKEIGPHPEAPVTVGGGRIGDTIYRDWNGNGIQDAGEEGISGVTVQLYKDVNGNGVYDAGDTLAGTTTTDANGNYLFNGLLAGNYVVRIPTPPSDYINTGNPLNEGAATIVGANDQVLTVDFGYKYNSAATGAGTIGDSVFADDNNNGVQDGTEDGIPNVTVNLYEDSNGNGVIDTGDLLIATTSTADGTTFFDPPTNSDPIPAGYYQFT
ncbi:MAG: SpaA isopeptide-forming pilin-related protein, partial [Verrucomicrobia bacterium]|nr:SpaA isopeptide-forming pilin-related protein [Verrucomicrobiota bacterium]